MNSTAYTLAARSKRFLGSMIDGTLGIIAIAGIFIVGDMSSRLAAFENASPIQKACIVIGAFIASWLLFLLMHCYLLATRGQTIGKYLTRTRIVNLSGNTPALWRILLLRYFTPSAIMQIPIVGGIAGFVNPLFIFRKNRRCLHDYLAGTQVIEATGKYAIITTNAYRVLGGVSLALSLMIALWARAHSPNMGLGEQLAKEGSYLLNQPIYYVVLLMALLFSIVGIAFVILGFKNSSVIPPQIPTSLSTPSQLDELKKAKSLLDSGAISDGEYQEIKSKILNRQ